MIVTSKEYEHELENENEQNAKWITELETTNDQLEKELEKLQMRYNNEVKLIEKENETLKKQINDTSGTHKLNQHKLVNLEIDNEDLER